MSDRTIETERDGIETAILLALHAKNKGRVKTEIAKDEKGWSKVVTGMEIYCPRKPEFPSEMYAFDAHSAERLYTSTLDDIVVDPVATIGRGIEVAFLCGDGTLKWTAIKPMPTPRGLVALSNRKTHWFSWHFRTIKESSPDTYVRRAMPISDGRVPLMKPLGWKGFNQEVERRELEEQLALMLSVFEDAHRANCMLATVEESAKIKFPIGGEAYKSFFAIRDGLRDTPTGRRNPILHWCNEHIRSRGDKVFPVSGHERGAETLVCGPMRLTIERPRCYTDFSPE